MYIAIILLSVTLQYVNGYAENICKVPNGDAGRCVNILRCKPLWEIYTKKRKTDAEHKFISQSFCGDPSTLIVNVCCPSIFVWHNFEPNPVHYHNPLDDLDDTPYTLPPFTPSASSSTEIPHNNKVGVPDSERETTMLIQNNNQDLPVPIIETAMPLQNNNQDLPVPIIETTMPLQNNNQDLPVPIIETTMPLQNNNQDLPVPVIETTMPLQQNNNNDVPVTEGTLSLLPQNNNTEVPELVIEATSPVTTVTDPGVLPLTNSPVEPQLIALIRDSNTTISTDDNDDNVFTNWLNNNTTCGLDQSRGNKITGGDVAEIDAYPWLVLLEYASGSLGCGGSLITARFVLTAAHCVGSRLRGPPTKARLAEFNISSFPTDIVEVDGGGYEEITVTIIDVENVWSHPNFTFYAVSVSEPSLPVSSHDIGLVKLSQDVEFSDFIQTICLPYSDFTTEFTDNSTLTVAGWGDEKTKTKDFDVKKFVKVPYVPIEQCRNTHRRLLLDTQICAGGEKGKDSCNGDSGGPLMYSIDNRSYVVGVVSYGHKVCGTEGQPAVYTNVFKYMKWISDVINERV